MIQKDFTNAWNAIWPDSMGLHWRMMKSILDNTYNIVNFMRYVLICCNPFSMCVIWKWKWKKIDLGIYFKIVSGVNNDWMKNSSDQITHSCHIQFFLILVVNNESLFVNSLPFVDLHCGLSMLFNFIFSFLFPSHQ